MENKPMPAETAVSEGPKRTRIIIELEGASLKVGGDIQDTVIVCGMLERAKHIIQKRVDDEQDVAAAQADILANMKNGVFPMPPKGPPFRGRHD